MLISMCFITPTKMTPRTVAYRLEAPRETVSRSVMRCARDYRSWNIALQSAVDLIVAAACVLVHDGQVPEGGYFLKPTQRDPPAEVCCRGPRSSSARSVDGCRARRDRERVINWIATDESLSAQSQNNRLGPRI